MCLRAKKTAGKQVESFGKLKAEINSQIGNINERILALRMLVRENIQSEDSPLGLLRGKEEQYLECLDLKQAALNELLKKDEAHWNLNQEQARQKADEVNA